eukprot:1159571-Pelagomonas_calceolata.AAC.11
MRTHDNNESTEERLGAGDVGAAGGGCGCEEWRCTGGLGGERCRRGCRASTGTGKPAQSNKRASIGWA